MAAANQTLADVQAKNWGQATNDWGNVENIVESVSDSVRYSFDLIRLGPVHVSVLVYIYVNAICVYTCALIDQFNDFPFFVSFYNILDRSGDDAVKARKSLNSSIARLGISLRSISSCFWFLILIPIWLAHRHLHPFVDQEDQLNTLMNGPIKKKLNIPSS